MIVFVEAVTLERDAYLRKDLLDDRAAHVGFAVVGLRTLGKAVVGKRLPNRKHLAGATAAVVVGGHRC